MENENTIKAPEEMTDEEFAEYVMNLSQENDAEEYPSAADAVPKENEVTPLADDAEETAPFRSFATGEELDEYVKSQRGGAYDKMLAVARERFPDSVSDEAAIESLAGEYEEDAAASAGMSREEYTDRRDFENWKAQKSRETEAQEQARSIAEKWKSDAENLRTIVPDFDLAKAFENNEFKTAVLSGKSIFEAYKESNRPRDMPKQKVAEEIGSGAYASVPGEGSIDLLKLDNERFMQKLKEIKDNG